MHKSRDLKGIKRALIALVVICVVMAGEFAFAGVTMIKQVLINENDPRVLSRIREMSTKNIAKNKNLWFNIGKDYGNNKTIKNNTLADIALELEECGYDSFSVIEFTLKSGKKIGGMCVLARKKEGQFKDFMAIMKEIIGNNADDGNCVVTISQIKESDSHEVYTIYFDYEYNDIVEVEETATSAVNDDKVQPKGCLFPF